jgi:hypothetical protein
MAWTTQGGAAARVVKEGEEGPKIRAGALKMGLVFAGSNT